MPLKPTIVLDKSFLQGSKASHIRELAESHRLLMSDALFYELISNPVDRRTCFSKFPEMDNPVDLITHVGGCIRNEVDMHKPSGKPSSNIEDIQFRFNSTLLQEDYELPADMQLVVDEHTAELRDDVASFLDRSRLISLMFPGLFTGSDAQRNIARRKAEQVIATDTQALLGFYSLLESPSDKPPLPSAKLVTPEWTLFRWLQVQMLFALHTCVRYNGSVPETLTGKMYERFEHDVLDAQYLILGVLEGSFATRENKLKSWWALICPEGTLYE